MLTLTKSLILFLFLEIISIKCDEHNFLDDICGHINGQRIYLDYGEGGTLEAKYVNNVYEKFTRKISNEQKRCTIELIACPSCVIKIKFEFLNVSKNCGRSTVFDACGCDYVWIYEPSFEPSSEQYCDQLSYDSLSMMKYHSQTRKVVVVFYYKKKYEHAFTLEYYTDRNKKVFHGAPTFGNMNNSSQTLSSPFFPNTYPSDLIMEHVINCEVVNETCRVSLVFTDFLIASSSIIDFFDSNSERIYVTSGNIFRPPVITTSGPSLVIRFYANGAVDLGFKAYYSFMLGQYPQRQLTPNIDCGGQVNNLGGGITMMDMVHDGLKFYDCIWLIKPPETYLHMKTHLYVKVVNFSGFAGNSELIIRQGLTSNGPIVENLKLSLAHFYLSKKREHTVTVSQGFYIRLKGLFRPESRLALVYAAFNYKDCLAASDFLCQNKRCISSLLNCDGFDHCGDNTDELTSSCSREARNRRLWSMTPHFFFPKAERFSQIATSTVVFLLCSLGLISFIFATIILLYRINLKTRHQRQIQDHIETINAILEDGVGEVEEEIIIPDDPPDYEAPPDYNDVMKSCSRCNTKLKKNSVEGSSTTQSKVPDSPPPAYDRMQLQSASFRYDFEKSIHQTFLFSSFSYSTKYSFLRRSKDKYKYFSDSDLISQLYILSEDISDSNNVCLKKSFTTDDINLFI